MKIATAFFRRKAEQCRRLAHELAVQGDRPVPELLSMAEEFEENARALETRIGSEAARESGLDEILRLH